MIDDISKEEEKVLLRKSIGNLLNDSRLSAWEKDFLKSIDRQILAKGLSEKQVSVLNKIRQKCR